MEIFIKSKKIKLIDVVKEIKTNENNSVVKKSDKNHLKKITD